MYFYLALSFFRKIYLSVMYLILIFSKPPTFVSPLQTWLQQLRLQMTRISSC